MFVGELIERVGHSVGIGVVVHLQPRSTLPRRVDIAQHVGAVLGAGVEAAGEDGRGRIGVVQRHVTHALAHGSRGGINLEDFARAGEIGLAAVHVGGNARIADILLHVGLAQRLRRVRGGIVGDEGDAVALLVGVGGDQHAALGVGRDAQHGALQIAQRAVLRRAVGQIHAPEERRSVVAVGAQHHPRAGGGVSVQIDVAGVVHHCAPVDGIQLLGRGRFAVEGDLVHGALHGGGFAAVVVVHAQRQQRVAAVEQQIVGVAVHGVLRIRADLNRIGLRLRLARLLRHQCLAAVQNHVQRIAHAAGTADALAQNAMSVVGPGDDQIALRCQRRNGGQQHHAEQQ